MNPYLKTKVMTASPEELRLMLFEGAIKFCRQGVDAIGRSEWDKMYDALVRAQKIILELSNSLNHNEDPDLCDKLAALYNYIYRRLVDGNIERDADPINEAIGLLDYERETWLMVMTKLQQEREAGNLPMSDVEYQAPIGRIGPKGVGTEGNSPRPSISVEG